LAPSVERLDSSHRRFRILALGCSAALAARSARLAEEEAVDDFNATLHDSAAERARLRRGGPDQQQRPRRLRAQCGSFATISMMTRDPAHGRRSPAVQSRPAEQGQAHPAPNLSEGGLVLHPPATGPPVSSARAVSALKEPAEGTGRAAVDASARTFGRVAPSSLQTEGTPTVSVTESVSGTRRGCGRCAGCAGGAASPRRKPAPPAGGGAAFRNAQPSAGALQALRGVARCRRWSCCQTWWTLFSAPAESPGSWVAPKPSTSFAAWVARISRAYPSRQREAKGEWTSIGQSPADTSPQGR
jgi:hypothetical protein